MLKLDAKIRILFCQIALGPMLAVAPASFADQYDNEWENVANTTEPTESENVEAQVLERQQSEEGEKLKQASGKQVRRFHEVLDELLAEFGYDVRMGQLKGLKNVSIRRVDVSDALPNTCL